MYTLIFIRPARRTASTQEAAASQIMNPSRLQAEAEFSLRLETDSGFVFLPWTKLGSIMRRPTPRKWSWESHHVVFTGVHTLRPTQPATPPPPQNLQFTARLPSHTEFWEMTCAESKVLQTVMSLCGGGDVLQVWSRPGSTWRFNTSNHLTPIWGDL